MTKYYAVVFMGNPHYVTEEKLYDHVEHGILVGDASIYTDRFSAELRLDSIITEVWPARFWEIVEVEA